MKVIKAIFAILLSAVVLLSGAWYLAASAVSHLADRSVLDPMLDQMDLSAPIAQVMDSSLDGMDDLTRQLIATEAVGWYIEDFISEYIDAILFEDALPWASGEALEPVLYAAIEELQTAGVSDTDALLLEGIALMVPQLAAQTAQMVNAAIPSRDALLGQLGLSSELLADLIYLAGPTVQTIVLVFALIAGFVILLLYWKRGGGFLWNGILFAILGAVCAIGGIVLRSMASQALSAYGLLPLASAMQQAFLIRGGIAFAIGVVLLLIGILIRANAKPPAPPPARRVRHGA